MRSAVHARTSHRRTLRSGLIAAMTAALLAVGLGSVALAGLSTSTTTSAPSTPSGTAAHFVHPGVFVSRPQLDFVRQKVQAGAEPWTSAYKKMLKSSYASLTRVAAPRPIVECGPYSNPNRGCSEEKDDSTAAYTDALAWYLTRDDRYAKKSIELMDAWARTLRGHTNSNAPLQSALSAAEWARAGELLRYTYGGWASADQARFTTMLRTLYLPLVANGATNKNGNWELIMMDATSGMAVFLDDHATFDRAIAIWRQRVPEYMYVKTDGSLPDLPSTIKPSKAVGYWQGQSTFVDGLAQETCRDFGHTGWGFDAATHTAETGRIQGIDLYGEQKSRMAKAFEFHAGFELGATVPSWLCHGRIIHGMGSMLEVAYNALHNRLGVSMPNTEKVVLAHRPTSTNAFIAWETLTNAENTVASPSTQPTPSPRPSGSPTPKPSPTPSPSPTPAPPGTTSSYEAERANLSGSAQSTTCHPCSAGGRVHFIGHSVSGWATFPSVPAAKSGSALVTISYLNGDVRARGGQILVNGGVSHGGSSVSVSYPPTGSWLTVGTTTVAVSLRAGTNTLALGSDAVYGPNLDKISVTAGGPATYEAEATANTIVRAVVRTGCASCSGGARVASVGLGATLRFNGVTAPIGGWRQFTVYYGNADPTARTVLVSVNGGPATTVSLPPTGGWDSIHAVSLWVQVRTGSNTVLLSNPSAVSGGFDRITI